MTDPSSKIDRPCTCHPDDRPPTCQRRYAAHECRAAHVETLLTTLREHAYTAGRYGQQCRGAEELDNLKVVESAHNELVKLLGLDHAIRAMYTETQIREFCGYVTSYLTELGETHPGSVWDAWESYLKRSVKEGASAHETTAPHPLDELIGAGLVKDSHTFYVRLTFAELGDAQRVYQWAQNYLQTPDNEPQPQPNGRCKCQYCGEGFVMWGDTSVHERSCSKNPAFAQKASAPAGDWVIVCGDSWYGDNGKFVKSEWEARGFPSCADAQEFAKGMRCPWSVRERTQYKRPCPTGDYPHRFAIETTERMTKGRCIYCGLSENGSSNAEQK